MTKQNGSGQITVPVSPVEQQSMTQVQDRLDSPAYLSDDEEVRRGQQAWSRLKKDPSWADWISVGKAHLKGRQAAMRDACTNKSTGRRYNQIFGEWLTRHGFDGIDSGDRRRLFEVMKHLDEIEGWRATLPTTNRLRLNHPATVLRKWHAKTQIPSQSDRLSPYAQLRESLVHLSEENERLKQEIKRGGGDLWNADDRSVEPEREAAEPAEPGPLFAVAVAKAVAAAKRDLIQRLEPHLDALEQGVALLRGDAERRDASPMKSSHS
jgi:hypothetical protein